MSDINEGEAFIAGRSQANAAAVLAAAEAAGVDASLVRTSSRGGYIVPEAVADKYEAPEKAPEPEPVKTTDDGVEGADPGGIAEAEAEPEADAEEAKPKTRRRSTTAAKESD